MIRRPPGYARTDTLFPYSRLFRSQVVGGMDRRTLERTGREIVDIAGIADGLKPRSEIACTITYADGTKKQISLLCRIDTLDELEYYRHGGILQYVLRNMLKAA